MHSNIRLLLIDLDDTLWATQRNNRDGLQELYTVLDWGQYFVSFEAYYDVYIRHNNKLWDRYNHGLITKEELCVERLSHPLKDFLDLSEESWLSIDEEYRGRVRLKRTLCPHALEVLAYLHERYRICILSNGFRELQYDKLERSGLSRYCHGVVLSDEVGYNKPDPRIFAHALEQMGCSVDETLMIGDSWGTDITGATASGIRSLWYNPEHLSLPEDAGQSTLLTQIHDLRELYRLL